MRSKIDLSPTTFTEVKKSILLSWLWRKHSFFLASYTHLPVILQGPTQVFCLHKAFLDASNWNFFLLIPTVLLYFPCVVYSYLGRWFLSLAYRPVSFFSMSLKLQSVAGGKGNLTNRCYITEIIFYIFGATQAAYMLILRFVEL